MFVKIKLLLSFMLFFLLINANGHCDNKSFVKAYYFYTTARCPSCYKIEQYTNESLNKNYAAQIKAGVLNYEKINIDENGNGHYVQQYQLYTKSVVLSLVKDGKEIKNKKLDKVWEYLGNKDKFIDYVKNETGDFLKEIN